MATRLNDSSSVNEAVADKAAKRKHQTHQISNALYYNFDADNNVIIPPYDELPILSKREEILRLVKENRVLIITGETGSGKSTQVPQYILDDMVKNGEEGKPYIVIGANV